MSEQPDVVVGGSIAALAAADALAGAGRPVRLWLPGRGVGGGFLPMERDGRRLELGMRVLELHYEGTGTPPPLADYRPDDEGHRPFVALVDAWVRDLVGDAVVPVDEPATFLGGRLGPEVLLSSDVSRAAELVTPEDAWRIAGEAAEAARRHGDAGWLAPDAADRLATASFDEASLHQHGARFHELFLAPFTAKIRPAGGADVVAGLRRKLWVPLFWPRTVAEAFGGDPVSFVPERPLSVVRPSGGMGPVVQALLDRLRARGVTVVPYERVTGVASDPAGVRVEFSDGRVETARRPVLGLSAAELFAAAGVAFAPEKVRSVLAWVGVRDDDVLRLPGFVHVLDPAVPAYRVTPGERGADGVRAVCVELAHDVPADSAAGTAADVLRRIGVLREGAATTDLGVFSGPTFTDPTAATVQAHAAAYDAWRSRGVDAVVVGGALSFGADSFNEQVVQALQVAETVS